MKNSFTNAFKKATVKRAGELKKVAAAARELSMADQTLRDWTKQLNEAKSRHRTTRAIYPK